MALQIGELVAHINVNASKAESAISDFQSKMQSAGSNVAQRFQSIGGAVSDVGGKISGVGGSLTKGITAPAAGAALAVGGITAALGWGRLVSIDSAQAQLKGLGYSAEDVERISGQLTDALEGGMLTMGEATSAAAAGMASGVEEGEELTKYIQVLDGAVAGSNGTFDEMNQIFARIQGSGKLMTGELQMIEQRMPGFTGTMADSFGVTQDEMQKMVTNGEVSADEFMDVMDDFAGDMAKAQAQSWSGMVADVGNYVGIIGQALLGGVFEQSKDSISEFLDFLKSDDVSAWAATAGAAIGDAFIKILGVVRSVIDWFVNLDGTWQKAILTAAGIVVALGPVLLVVGHIITAIGGTITAIGTIMGVVSKLSVVFTGISKVIGIVVTAVRTLSAAMLANPAVLITAAIVALVAALIWFFTQTELGQQIVEQVVDGAIIAWEWLRDTSIAVFEAIVDAVVGAWTWIRDKTTEIWDSVTSWVTDNWSTIVDFLALLNPVTAVIRHWDKIKAATSAAWQWVKDKISTVWNGTIQLVANAGARVVAAVTGAWGKAKSLTSSAWQAVLNTITGIAGRIRAAVVNMGSQAVSAVLNAWNRAKSTTVNAWNGMRAAVSNGIVGVVNFVRGLPGRVLGALGNIGSTLLGSGRALIDGFTQGIKNAFGRAVDAVKNGLTRVRNYFPFSPAKEGPFSGKGWTLNSGQAISEGLADGMESRTSSVVRAAEAITRAAALDVPTNVGLASAGRVSGNHPSPVSESTQNFSFTINNPVAEPTSETARKASAYIGVSV